MPSPEVGANETQKAVSSTAPKTAAHESSEHLNPRGLDDLDSDKPSAFHNTEKGRNSALNSSGKHALWLISITVCLAPALLLAAFTKPLSSHVGRSGCMPSGDFVVPHTVSIWAPSQFFVPSLRFHTGHGVKYSSLTTVRIVDLAWDLAIARGGHALLAWRACKVFRHVFSAQMQTSEVGYDVFGMVALHTGELRTLSALGRRAFGKMPLPRTPGARLTHAAIAFVTLYLLALPTLFSATTGYVSVAYPVLDLSQVDDVPSATVNDTVAEGQSANSQDCHGPLLPAFGVIHHTCLPWAHGSRDGYRMDLCRFNDMGLANLEMPDFSPLTYNWPPWTCGAYDYNDYYEQYRHLYEKFPRVSERFAAGAPTAGCEALEVPSSIILQCPDTQGGIGEVHLQPPLLNLSIFANHDSPRKEWDGVHRYNHYSCGAKLIFRNWLDGYNPPVVGSCTAWGTYAWGFSFHFVFVVSILNCIVAAILYGLWLYARKLTPRRSDTNSFLDAALMISRAQQQFGINVHEWPAKKVNEVILKGDQGMADPSAAYLRLRNLR